MALVAVAGSVAQRPRRGGHAWVFLNYLLGLRKLGHEVFFVDRLTTEMVGAEEQDVHRSPQAGWLDQMMATIGFDNDYFLLVDGPASKPASTRDHLLDRLRRTDLLINVNGFLRDAELLDAPEVTAFLDIDPSIQQMWEALGLAELFAGHDLHFTVGANIGRQSCQVPTCGISWIPTLPPVVMEEWPVAGRGEAFTTVASWRGPYGPIEYRGESYGLRVHEFRQLTDLPGQMEDPVAIALDIDPEDQADSDLLRDARWRLLDPFEVAGDPTSYREFIEGSKAELSIAKNVYVRSRCGWFSDRSACYLASGRPVLAQDTGYSENLPTDGGLIPFANLDEAIAGAREIHQDWPKHSRAAREIAGEHFDSNKVLERMLNVAGI
jgi:glycosyltransferase involved in cell wall biosynthesis